MGIDVFPLNQQQSSNNTRGVVTANFINDDGDKQITIEDKVIIASNGLTVLPIKPRTQRYFISETSQLGPQDITFKLGNKIAFTATFQFLIVGKIVNVSMYDIQGGENLSNNGIMESDDAESLVDALPVPIGSDEIIDILLINWLSITNTTVNRANNNAVLRLKRQNGSILPKLYIENGTKDKNIQEWDFSNINFLPFPTNGFYIAK